MWDLPGPGLEPVSPALASGFLTTAPPGKPHVYIYLNLNLSTVEEAVVVIMMVSSLDKFALVVQK